MKMEKRCNVLTFVSVIYTLFIWFKADRFTTSDASIFAILLLESVFVLIFSPKADELKDQSKYRPDVDPNLMCVFLVPLCLLSEMFSFKQKLDPGTGLDDIHLSFGVMSAIITKYFFMLKQQKIPAIATFSIVMVYLVTFAHFGVVLVHCVSTVLIWKSLDWIPRIVPKSFSFAEMSICLQLCLVVVGRILRELSETQDVIDDEHRLKWIGTTAVTAILLATASIWIFKAFRSVLSFIGMYAVFAVASLAFLTWRFKENVLLWMWQLILGDCTVVMLLMSWVCLCGITVIWTVCRALQSPLPEQKKLSEYSNDMSVVQDECVITSESCRKRKADFTSDKKTNREKSHETVSHQLEASNSGVSLNTRKVFHLFILLVYIPGLLLAPRILLLASSIALGIFIIVEAARVLQVPGVGHHLDNVLRFFVDERDQGVLFLTHFYLLVGLSLPLWITYSPLSGGLSSIKLYSGVLSLGIGDTVACMAGRAFGRIRWKGTIKTVEGTCTSVLAQLGFIYIFAYLGFLPDYSHISVIFGVIHGALYEAFTDQIDNLVLPLALFPFLIAY